MIRSYTNKRILSGKPTFLNLSEGVLTALLAYSSLLLFTFVIYLVTLTPGVYGFDSAELATGVYTQGIIHPSGFPLYLLIGKCFTLLPVGDISYRLNLMSAVFATVTVLLLYTLIKHIVENAFTAWLAALGLAVSYYFWQMAVVTEVYTLATAFLVADLLLIILWRSTASPRYLIGFAFFYGLTLSTHTSCFLLAPAFAWLIIATPSWKKTCWRWVPLMFGVFLAGLTPYIYLYLRARSHPIIDYSSFYSSVDITTLPGFIWYISGKAYNFFAFGYTWQEIPREIARFASYLWRNYFGVGVILGLVGLVCLFRKKWTLAVGIVLVLVFQAGFYINYRVMDKDTMFLPSYLVFAILIGVGLQATKNLLKRYFRDETRSETWYKNILVGVQITLLVLAMTLNWRWTDMSQSTDYAAFGRSMMASAKPNSVIVAPWSCAVVLEYYQVVEGMRPDLTIFNESRVEVARYYEMWVQGYPHYIIVDQISAEEITYIDSQIQEKPVYAVEYDPVLAARFRFIPEGSAFSLVAP